MIGIVKFIDREKNFGFIKCEEYPSDVFFHRNSFDGDFKKLTTVKDLQDKGVTRMQAEEEADSVSFEVVDTPRGIAAEKVRLEK